ncbi:MAG: ATP-dependent nuclease [Daejeonella sp.]
MKGGLYIKQLLFKNGLNQSLKSNSIVLFVGPNNSGKSAVLKEMFLMLYGNNSDFKVLKSVEPVKTGTVEDYLKRLESNKSGNQYMTISGATSHADESVISHWNTSSFSMISQYLVKRLDTVERLTLVNPPATVDLVKRQAKHPFHKLQLDDKLELEFSKYFKLAFNEEIIVNFGAGASVPLHVGKRPKITAKNDRVSTKYQEELRQLDQLHNQGDGMKSFAGLFLALLSDNYSINLVDEPEAFLHPPQAKILGQMIAKNLGLDKQIFIATHSEHFLKGLLECAGERLVIIRLEREGKITKTSVLENSDLTEIWKDSILRHSNILDGLFHSKVVLTESDSDSRFFSTMVSTILDNENISSPDIHFIHSGGKLRFPVIIKALKKVNVPLLVIGDFDLLNAESPLKEMYEAMGGKWADINKHFNIVKRDIDVQRPELNTTDLKINIEKIFQTISEPVVPNDKLKILQQTIRKASAWSKAKTAGQEILTAGDAVKAFNFLMDMLERVGIIVLPIGELEAFDKTVGGHGQKWVNSVLEKDLYTDPELAKAKLFVTDKILKRVV